MFTQAKKLFRGAICFSSTSICNSCSAIVWLLEEDDEEEETNNFEDGINYDDYDEGGSAAEEEITIVKQPNRKRKSKRRPLIAIVGRPNVGKSALVNRIAGTQSGEAIVSEEIGITRDRAYRSAEFLGEDFQILDTGGIVRMKTAPGVGTKANHLVAARKSCDEQDDTIKYLRKYCVVSKEEKYETLTRYENARTAFMDDSDDDDEEVINVAIVGRPNVGKSSLLNSLFGYRRAIVSVIAGTTRDSIDAVVRREELGTTYRFLDMAGIRRKSEVSRFWSRYFMVNRALRAVCRADVVLLVMDATEGGVAEQDRILLLIFFF